MLSQLRDNNSRRDYDRDKYDVNRAVQDLAKKIDRDKNK